MAPSTLPTISELVEYPQAPVLWQRRLIGLHGEVNIEIRNADRHYVHADLWSTLLDLPWHLKFFVVTLVYSSALVLFGAVWYFVALAHGDLSMNQLSVNQTSCVTNLRSFTSAFLFSLETQATIGYGVRRISEECPLAISILVLQLLLTVVLDTVLAAIILAEFSRPSRRSLLVKFSRKVLVTHVNGVPCLVIRVSDTKRCFLINCQVSAKLFITKPSSVRAAVEIVQKDIRFLEGMSTHNPLLAFPVSFYHSLDKQSPLWGLSMENMAEQRFELVVVLSGVVASTGTTCQARVSYLPNDIMWGYQFLPAMTVTEKGHYRANPAALNIVNPEPNLKKNERL